jgi:hypothetical protein
MVRQSRGALIRPVPPDIHRLEAFHGCPDARHPLCVQFTFNVDYTRVAAHLFRVPSRQFSRQRKKHFDGFSDAKSQRRFEPNPALGKIHCFPDDYFLGAGPLFAPADMAAGAVQSGGPQ